MDKTFYFKLLNHIYDDSGINYYSDLSTVLAEQYPEDFEYGTLDRIARITELLESIQKSGYIFYKIVPKFNEKYPFALPYGHEISAYLTPLGFQFLNDKKRDESAILTNQSVMRNSRNQTRILVATLLISLASLSISLLNYVLKQPQQILQLPKKPIEILIKDKSSLSTDTSRRKEAKKTSQKKP